MDYECFVDTDLTQLPTVKKIYENMFSYRSDISGEHHANRIGVRVTNGGVPVDFYYSVTGTTNKERAADIQTKYFEIGNVKLLSRPQVPVSKLSEAGWTNVGTGTATVFSSSYSAGTDGIPWGQNIIIHITPIRKDGSVLSPSELDGYVDDLLEATTVKGVLKNDESGLILWVQTGITNWNTGYVIADMYDDLLHRLQAVYYLDDSDMPTETEIREFTVNTVQIRANVVKADGTTDDIPGYVRNTNEAFVLLNNTQYSAIGKVGVYLRVASGARAITLGGVEGYIYPSAIGELVT